MVSDETKPEDLDSDGEDHACDAIRYFCMSRPYPAQTALTLPPVFAPGTMGHLRQSVRPKTKSRLGGESVRHAC